MRAATDAVIAASAALFGRGDLAGSDPDTLAAALSEAGVAVLEPGRPRPRRGVPFVTVFVRTGLVSGTSAARRAINEGGAYLNNQRVRDIDQQVTAADLLHGRWLVLRRGKRNFAAADASVLAR